MSLCRYCHSDAVVGDDAIAPCQCRGELEAVHRDCLATWLTSQPGRISCELCHAPYACKWTWSTKMLWLRVFCEELADPALRKALSSACRCPHICECFGFGGWARHMSRMVVLVPTLAACAWLGLQALGAPGTQLEFLTCVELFSVIFELYALVMINRFTVPPQFWQRMPHEYHGKIAVFLDVVFAALYVLLVRSVPSMGRGSRAAAIGMYALACAEGLHWAWVVAVSMDRATWACFRVQLRDQ